MRFGPGDLKRRFAATGASATRPVCSVHVVKYGVHLRAEARLHPLFEGVKEASARFSQASVRSNPGVGASQAGYGPGQPDRVQSRQRLSAAFVDRKALILPAISGAWVQCR